MDRKRWSLSEKIAGLSISAVLLFIVTAAIAGVIGGRTDALLILVWAIFVKANVSTWVVTLLILIVSLVLALIVVQRHCGVLRIELRKTQAELSKVNGALDTMNLLIGLDDSLLRLLASWMSTPNQESGMKLLLADLLQDATKAFDGEVHRSIVFLPDAPGEYLHAWAYYQMPQESVRRSVFYIGKTEDGRKRGLAGEAFLMGTVQVAHITRKGAKWSCDHDNCYINFDRKRPFPPYHSLVCVPIIGGVPALSPGSTTTCLGVVCFDSPNPTAFDNPGALSLLQVFGRRIASALLIYEQIRRLPSVDREENHAARAIKS